MKTIAFVNQKGGVGKTTTCINVGAGLSRRGKRVLLVDTDPQGNLTKSAGIQIQDDEPTVYDVLRGKADVNGAIKQRNGYDVLPATIMLSSADIELSNIPGRELLLKESVEGLNYDYILIDCPPALTVVTVMGLTAADGIIVPVQPHFLALSGIAQLMDTCNVIKRRINPKLTIYGFVMTQWNNRLLLHSDVLEAINNAFPGKVFDTMISNSIALAEAPSYGQDIFEYKPACKAATQYDSLVNEIMGRI